MNWRFFILGCSLLVCCKERRNKTGGPSLSISDRNHPSIHSSIAPFALYSSVQDSIHAVKEKDSFYHILPLKEFTNDTEANCWNKLTASFIDTSMVLLSPVKIVDTEVVQYDKEQNPISTKHLYRGKDFIVQVNKDCYFGNCPRRFFINRKVMRLQRLDTGNLGDWYMNDIQLDKEDFFTVRINSRSFYLARGYVEGRNGTSCGVHYFLLYDIQNKKAIVYQQFRNQRFLAGYDKTTGEVEVLVSEDKTYDPRLDCLFLSGRIFRITKTGQVKTLKNKMGESLYYKGYYTMNAVESIHIIAGNFRD